MTDTYQNLRIERRDRVAVLTIDRPKVLNALDAATMKELDAAFAELGADESVQAVIVTGAGDRAFVAGADINELAKQDSRSGYETSLRGQRVFRRIETLGKPVIAAVNGYALGGGLELALACHLRIAAEGARMGLPEVSLGAIPGYGGTQRLARLIGKGRALEMILTGERIDAAEAFRTGLVNRVVPAERLLASCEEMARKILSNGPLAVRHALDAVERGLDGALEEGLVLEASLFGVLCGTEDYREGMKAFQEKRPPRFEGR